MSRNNGQAMTGHPGSWWGVLSVFVDERMRTISPVAACIWLVLFRNSRDGVVQISQGQIADAVGVKKRFVCVKIKELIDVELIRVERQGRRNLGPSRYRLLMVSTRTLVRPESDQSACTTVRTVKATGRTSMRTGEDSQGAPQCAPYGAPQCAPLHKREQDGVRPADACASRSDVNRQNEGAEI